MSEESAPKKRVAKKSTRKVASKKVARKKTTVKSSNASKEAVERTSASTRKAPTAVATRESSYRRARTTIILGGAICVVLLGAGVAIGLSDSGQIDVRDQIAAQRESASPEEQAALDQMARSKNQATEDGRPNGGLVPSSARRKSAPAAPPPADTSTTSATSTDEAASSSPAVTEDTSTTTEATTDVTEPNEIEGETGEEGITATASDGAATTTDS